MLIRFLFLLYRFLTAFMSMPEVPVEEGKIEFPPFLMPPRFCNVMRLLCFSRFIWLKSLCRPTILFVLIVNDLSSLLFDTAFFSRNSSNLAMDLSLHFIYSVVTILLFFSWS